MADSFKTISAISLQETWLDADKKSNTVKVEGDIFIVRTIGFRNAYILFVFFENSECRCMFSVICCSIDIILSLSASNGSRPVYDRQNFFKYN